MWMMTMTTMMMNYQLWLVLHWRTFVMKPILEKYFYKILFLCSLDCAMCAVRVIIKWTAFKISKIQQEANNNNNNKRMGLKKCSICFKYWQSKVIINLKLFAAKQTSQEFFASFDFPVLREQVSSCWDFLINVFFSFSLIWNWIWN